VVARKSLKHVRIIFFGPLLMNLHKLLLLVILKLQLLPLPL